MWQASIAEGRKLTIARQQPNLCFTSFSIADMLAVIKAALFPELAPVSASSRRRINRRGSSALQESSSSMCCQAALPKRRSSTPHAAISVGVSSGAMSSSALTGAGSVNELYAVLADDCKVGQEITLQILRDDENQEVKVTLFAELR
jgi:hypothetical protein